MRLYYKRNWFFNILIVIMAIGACKKYVTVSPPITQLVTSNVFNNNAAATSALISIYQNMSIESYYMERRTGLLGDELTAFAQDAQTIQLYTNFLTTLSDAGPWTNAYKFIYQANAIIEGLQNSNTVSAAVQRQLTGEAKFIRAFWHFYLTNCYGDVPLVTSTDYRINGVISRSSQADVYQQIIQDLKDAQTLLNSNYVDGTDTLITLERVRPTKWVASAFLARVYLYMKDYVNASAEATSIISNTTFVLEDDLNRVFLANSGETIWQVGVTLPNQYNTAEGYYFILNGAPDNVAISPQLLNSFETDDKRKIVWIGSYATSDIPSETYYYPYKYKVYNSLDISEYTMMFRLAEQYLIRAEAEANGIGGGLNSAIGDLNVIRHRAGLTDYASPVSKDSVLSAILHERQVELFTEWGHRWFDLIRTDNVNKVMGEPGNVCQVKGGTWSPNWQFFPIPQSERNVDINLSQNPGY